MREARTYTSDIVSGTSSTREQSDDSTAVNLGTMERLRVIDPACLFGFEGVRFGDARRLKMKLRVVLEPSDEGGYTAIVPSLPGCISEGNTREEALRNIQEAVQVYLEPVDDDVQARPDAEVVEIAL